MTRTGAAATPGAGLRERVKTLGSRAPAPLLIGVLVSVLAGLNVWWRTKEARPPHWDMGYHLLNSLLYLDGFSLSDLPRFFQAYLFYPPLAYWIADIFFATLGSRAIWVAVLSNVVWLAVLALATYGIGRRLWTSRVGWMSVVFVLGAPMIVDASKDLMLDLPLTAMSALALYLIIRADGFSNRRFSLLFGACCGAALLVKWTFPLVIALPALHATVTAVSEIRLRRVFAPLANLFLALAAMLAICGTWYFHNWRQVAGSSLYYGGHGVDATYPRVATPASALYYFWNLLNVQLYLVPLVLVVVGVVYCFRRHELAKRNVYPLLMACGTYLLFSLLRHKDARYTLPMLPGLAIVATSWLEYVGRRARSWVEGGFVAYSAVAFLAISFGTSLLPRSIGFDVSAAGVGLSHVEAFGQHGYINGPPTRENWHQEDPFLTMKRVPERLRSFRYSGPDTIWFNKDGLAYYAIRYHIRFIIGGKRRPQFRLARGDAHGVPRGFVQREHWRLPDGGTLALYERS